MVKDNKHKIFIFIREKAKKKLFMECVCVCAREKITVIILSYGDEVREREEA